MRQFGDLYSQYYDLLYKDKDYEGEVDYISKLIGGFKKKPLTILDLGCGTGRHDAILAERGHQVHGVDQSEEMLKIAEKHRENKSDKLTFSLANITELELNKQFDVVISLFHVMSYQNTNADLIKSFQVAKAHLKDGGLFAFDFWYGPGVLTDLPVTRIKRLESNDIFVTRLAEPNMLAKKNLVEVNYNMFIENKKTHHIVQKMEQHRMRYFFDPELEIICDSVGLKIEKKHEWMSDKQPDFSSWNAVWVVKK